MMLSPSLPISYLYFHGSLLLFVPNGELLRKKQQQRLNITMGYNMRALKLIVFAKEVEQLFEYAAVRFSCNDLIKFVVDSEIHR